MRTFRFNLGNSVRICGGAENGTIVGRAEYLHSQNAYYVQYVAGNGRAVEAWWGEDALTLTTEA